MTALQPILWLILYSAIASSTMQHSGIENYTAFMLPGLIVTQLLDLQQQWNYELSDEIGWQLRSDTDCSAHTQLHCACTAF